MKVHEKTDKLLEELIYCDLRTSIGTDKAKQLIRCALKEQDRDTRLACAEAIVCLPGKIVSAWEVTVRRDVAHEAVMDCRGGIE